jgi:methyl-accepting chemotaxis protein
MKIERTIQSQIIRTLSILAFAVVVITGCGIYVVYEAKNPLQKAVNDYDGSREQIFNIRLALERIDLSYQLVYKSKLDTASLNLDMAKAGSVELVGILDSMVVRSSDSQYSAKQNIEKFRDKFLEIEGRERSAAVAFLSGKSSGAPSQASSTTNGFESLRTEISALNQKNLAHYERVLAQTLRSIVFMMVPVLLGLLIIPLSTFWAATRKINLDLIGYIRSLNEFSEQNEQSSEELRTSSELMSSASSQQSAAIQQSASSVSEIRTMLAETEVHVREVQTLTAQMNDETIQGSEIMQRLEKSMHAIEETNSQIASFEEILNSVRGKTQVINDIVFKTQLLSFNASIEAARAGHYGRGFSVVAEEVGKLAMMSGDAAREIDILLTQSADRVSHIVESVQERVVDGKTVSHEALGKFGHLKSKLAAISEKIDQVAHATIEQGAGIEQTAKAMEQVNQGAAENKRGADDIHRIADRVFELSAKIRAVTSGIRRFVREDKRAPKRDQGLSVVATVTANAVDLKTKKSSSVPRAVLSLATRSSSRSPEKSAVPPRASSSSIKEISADDPSFRKAGSQK